MTLATQVCAPCTDRARITSLPALLAVFRWTVKEPLGKVATYQYDTLHRLVGLTDPLGHTATSVLDGAGNTAASINALGDVTSGVRR